MAEILEIAVGRQLTQHRRSREESQANLDYLASLPRNTAFRLLPAESFDPVPQGIGWHYQGILRYEAKEYMSQERIKRDRGEILERVKEACSHVRWGRFPWHIESDEYQIPAADPAVPGPLLRSPSIVQEESCLLEQPPFLPPEGRIKKLSDRLALISQPSRLKILFLLKQGSMNVTEICAALGSQSQPNVSHELSKLRWGRLVEDRREGQHKYYSLTDDGHQLIEFAGRLIA